MPERFEAVRTFLQSAGWNGAAISLLANDASFRRYIRIHLDGRRAVVMDAPPSYEDVRPFMRIARHLISLSLSAPKILAADEENGFLLLEDFGNDTFSQLLKSGADEKPLYSLAVDVLVHLHSLAPHVAVPNGLPAYDEDKLLQEALLLVDWYLPAALCHPPREALRTSYIKAWKSVLPLADTSSPTLVLRDYHVDNLIRLPAREGIAACGLLDFQDAVSGSPAYDLMSLLEDARRDISQELKEHMFERYLQATCLPDRQEFETAFIILAAQRHAKVIGIFTRLWHRDGKNTYLAHIPRVWRLLDKALAHPCLAPVAKWIETHIPANKRRVPR